ncbi:MAG TPA: PKD domain-containing protein, partial [Chitinophagaceae bacterium]
NGNPVSGNGNNFNATQPGAYSVKVTDMFGCSSMAGNSVSLGYVAKPQARFSSDGHCVNVPIPFTNLTTVVGTGAVQWLWDFGDGSSSTSKDPVHYFNQAGNYTVRLTAAITSCAQFADSFVKTVTIVNPPAGVRYPTVNAVINMPQQLEARNIGNSYQWIPPVGLNNATIVNPVFRHNQPQEYRIRIRLSNGCSVTDTVAVRMFVEGELYIPKAWSPNNDGHNDNLYPILVGMMELKMFRVFNRWGQLMFETSTPHHGWNGIYNGKPQPSDTYTWTVEARYPDGKVLKRSGNSVLVR